MYKEDRQERDKDIQEMRKNGRTLRFIASKHGITRERVRQILSAYPQIETNSLDNNLHVE